MSHINAKLGLRPAGKRSMMKLPTDRDLRNRITAAKCPACDRTGARLSRFKGRGGTWLFCPGCSHQWELPAAP